MEQEAIAELDAATQAEITAEEKATKARERLTLPALPDSISEMAKDKGGSGGENAVKVLKDIIGFLKGCCCCGCLLGGGIAGARGVPKKPTPSGGGGDVPLLFPDGDPDFPVSTPENPIFAPGTATTYTCLLFTSPSPRDRG